MAWGTLGPARLKPSPGAGGQGAGGEHPWVLCWVQACASLVLVGASFPPVRWAHRPGGEPGAESAGASLEPGEGGSGHPASVLGVFSIPPRLSGFSPPAPARECRRRGSSGQSHVFPCPSPPRYFLTSFYTKYDQIHFILNTVSLMSVLIPKLPQLHGVRIFGINKY